MYRRCSSLKWVWRVCGAELQYRVALKGGVGWGWRECKVVLDYMVGMSMCRVGSVCRVGLQPQPRIGLKSA